MKTSELITLKEAAKYLRVKNVTLYRLAQRRKIPASKVGGLWRFKRNRIEAWLDENDVSKIKRKKK